MAKRKGLYLRGRIWWICYQGLDGQMHRETSGTDKIKDAERLLRKRKSAIDEGQEPEIKKIKNYSFKELAHEYLKWCKRQKSFDSKKYIVKQLVNKFGNCKLRKLSALALEQYQTELLQNDKKPATVNRHIATLKHMCTKSVDWEMVDEAILKKIRRVKLLPENNKRLRYLSTEECVELISSCEPHLAPIVITALNTGLRKGEILNLKWNENVDLKHGFILLDKTKNGHRREIPINDTLSALLSSIFTKRRIDIPYVFYNHRTDKKYKDVKRSFKTSCRRAKIHDFKFHDTRHTFASHLVMAGIDLTTVKELLGHKSVIMTLRYAHLAPAHKAKAVNILNGLVNNNPASNIKDDKVMRIAGNEKVAVL